MDIKEGTLSELPGFIQKGICLARMTALLATILGVVSNNTGKEQRLLLNQNKIRHICLMKIYSAGAKSLSGA